MNPVAMTIINPLKEIGQARDQKRYLLFSSPVLYWLSYGSDRIGLGHIENQINVNNLDPGQPRQAAQTDIYFFVDTQ